MGLVLFHGSDPRSLPWTTTKRDVDESSSLYRRAVKEMKKVTQSWIAYTNQRKTNMEEAKRKEQEASSESIFKIRPSPSLKVPTIQATPGIPMARVAYQKPRSEVKKAATVLGNSNMTHRGVGEKTFEYFLENEVEEDE